MLHRTDPTARCIVFSQWERMLAIVHTALLHNRVTAVRPGTAQARKLQDAVKLFCLNDAYKVKPHRWNFIFCGGIVSHVGPLR